MYETAREAHEEPTAGCLLVGKGYAEFVQGLDVQFADLGRVAPAWQAGQFAQGGGIVPVDERMSSEHGEFLGRKYLRHILPSAAPQPVHAPIVRATRLPGDLITAHPAQQQKGPGR
ncbi:hypothetical protein ACIHJG_11410 [Streptomyces sp. NPDC052415]|uniref:hypothetical protein n=1 Tax=Streptomyces sp. NPDC052415 TaxID=3365690 RepID=UPI0037D68F29